MQIGKTGAVGKVKEHLLHIASAPWWEALLKPSAETSSASTDTTLETHLRSVIVNILYFITVSESVEL